MKKILFLFLLLAGFALATTACEITVLTDGQQKKSIYKTGDEIVVIVQVKHVHRVCKLSIEETTYEPEGMKIISATDWKEISSGVFVRRMKLKVLASSTGNNRFVVRRKCSKENNYGLISFKTSPTNNNLNENLLSPFRPGAFNINIGTTVCAGRL